MGSSHNTTGVAYSRVPLCILGWTLFWKWAVVLGFGSALVGFVLYPPVNQPDDSFRYRPADYVFLLPGFLTSLLYVAAVGAGTDFIGRSPRAIILLRRLRRYNRRWRKLMRVEKERARRLKFDPTIVRRGSWRGFNTQSDDLGGFMRDRDLREWVRNAGIIGADFHAQYWAKLRSRGGGDNASLASPQKCSNHERRQTHVTSIITVRAPSVRSIIPTEIRPTQVVTDRRTRDGGVQ